MKRLVFIVEGSTEIVLVEKLIVPYLLNLGFTNPMHAQTIVSNRKQHKKGGVQSYERFKNEVTNTSAQGNVIITTLIDFYGLPTNFPEFTKDSTKIEQIEQAIHKDLRNDSNFIPYIQRHELEALLFCDKSGFELHLEEEKEWEEVNKIIAQYDNPEDINNNPETAPSKRLERIFNYDKVSDSEIILELIGIDSMLKKCPRFSNWIRLICEKLKQVS